MHSLLAITTPFALLSSYATRFELIHALRLSKATRLFVHPKLLPLVLPAAKEVGISSRKVYVLGAHVRGRQSFSEMIDHAETHDIPVVPARPARKDTLAYLIFSSGTSGLPKGARYCIASVAANLHFV